MIAIKHTIFVFFGCLAVSSTALYFLAGGFWGNPQQSPLRIVTSPSAVPPQATLTWGQKDVALYPYHKVQGARYFHYVGDAHEKDVEIYCKEVVPGRGAEVVLKEPVCFYSPRQSSSEWNTPAVLIVKALEGNLQQGTKRFKSLVLTQQVTVKGYDRNGLAKLETWKQARTKENSLAFEKSLEEHVVTTLEAGVLTLHLEARTLETESSVSLAHRGFISLEGKGLKGDARLEKLRLLRDVKAHILCQGLPERHKRNIAVTEIFSQSAGATEIQNAKEQNIIHVRQEDQVVMKSNAARLTAQTLHFALYKKTNQAQEPKPQVLPGEKKGSGLVQEEWELRRVDASGDVRFQDGNTEAKNTATAAVFSMENQGRTQKIVMTGQPVLRILDMEGFTILDPQRRKQFLKEQARFELKTLLVSCRDRLEWQREEMPAGQLRENFYFEEDVHFYETSQKVDLLDVRGSKARLILEERLQPGRTTSSRVPVFLEVVGNVILRHTRMDGSGDILSWRSITPERSETVLSGTPRLRLKEFSWGTGKNPLAAMSPVHVAKEPPKKVVEDIEILARQPMHIVLLEPPQQPRLLKYRAEEEVKVIRYQTGTDKVVGHLYCARLDLAAQERQPATAKEGAAQPGARKEKWEVQDLEAVENVRFASPEAEGGGERLLLWQRQGVKFFALVGQAWTRSDQGILRADGFWYNAEKEIFFAFGSPNTLESKEMAGKSRFLYYFKKTDHILFMGEPAKVWQRDDKGVPKHALYADYIHYWRESGQAQALPAAKLVFKVDKQELARLQAAKNQKAAPPVRNQALSSGGTYSLTASKLTAKFDLKQKSLQEFVAENQVRMKKLGVPDKEKQEHASGHKLTYAGKEAHLYGSPAYIFYQGHALHSEEVTMYETEERVSCKGPATVVLQKTPAGTTLLPSFGKTTALPKTPAATTKSGKIRIDCAGPIEFLQKDKHIIFNREVVVKMDEGKLWCERLQVLLDKDKNEIAGLIAHQNVKMVSDQHSAEGDQLYWDEQEGKLYLQGYPDVILRSDKFKLHSPVVWYDLRARKFFSQGGKDLQAEGHWK